MWYCRGGRFEDGNHSLALSEVYELVVHCTGDEVMRRLGLSQASYNDLMRLALRKLEIPKQKRQQFWKDNPI